MSDSSRPGSDTEPDHDVVLVHGRTPGGDGLRALRSRPGRLDLAEIRPVEDGRPIVAPAELVRLRERRGSPLLWDVDVLYASGDDARPSSGPPGHQGPPRVATDAFRRNWEEIFGDPDMPDDAGPN